MTQAGFVFAFLFLSAIGTLTYLSVNRLGIAADWTRHTEEVISTVHSLLSHVTEAESAQRGYAVNGQESYLQAFQAARRAAGADLQSLRSLIVDNTEQQHRLDIMEPLVARRMKRARAQIALFGWCTLGRGKTAS